MCEQILAHLGLHLHADDMAVVLHEKAQQHADYVQGKHHQARNDNGGVHFFRDINIEHLVGHDGVYHADNGDEQGCQHVQGKHLFVRFVVVNKAF